MNTTLTSILIVVLAVSFLAEWIVIKAAYKLRLFDKPNTRKIHHNFIPRLGGCIILPVLVLGLFLGYSLDQDAFLQLFKGSETSLVGLLMAAGVVYIFGFFDDLVNIRYRNKFVAQILSGLSMCLCGLFINSLHGFLWMDNLPVVLSWIVTVFSVVYISNAINFIDGIDGLAGSLGVIALIYYGVVFHMMGCPGFVMVCVLILIALVALLHFNLFGKVESKTKVFMGDAGSLSLGVLLCGLGVYVLQRAELAGSSSANFVLAVAPLMLPSFDVVRVVMVRKLNGKNVFMADKSHIHHKLLAMGLSQSQTLICLIFIDLVMVVTAVCMMTVINVNLVILIEVIMFTILVLMINRKMKK